VFRIDQEGFDRFGVWRFIQAGSQIFPSHRGVQCRPGQDSFQVAIRECQIGRHKSSVYADEASVDAARQLVRERFDGGPAVQRQGVDPFDVGPGVAVNQGGIVPPESEFAGQQQRVGLTRQQVSIDAAADQSRQPDPPPRLGRRVIAARIGLTAVCAVRGAEN